MGSKRTFGDFSCAGKVTPAERRPPTPAGTIPQSALRLTAPFAQGSLFASGERNILLQRLSEKTGHQTKLFAEVQSHPSGAPFPRGSGYQPMLYDYSIPVL